MNPKNREALCKVLRMYSVDGNLLEVKVLKIFMLEAEQALE